MIIGLVRGPWSLQHHHRWALTGAFPGHPIIALCHEDPVTLGPQD